jgi:hypothetical protein
LAVKGQHSNHAVNGQSVDPFKSEAIIGNINLLDVSYRALKITENKKYNEWNIPPYVRMGISLGIMENPTTVGWKVEKHNIWSITGVNHTHTPDETIPVFSAGVSGDNERPIGSGEGIGYLLECSRHLFPNRKLNAKTIRQSVIANLLKNGHDLRIVQAFAGHRCPSTTEKYRQSRDEELRMEIIKRHPMG